jgi:hypothetical protein
MIRGCHVLAGRITHPRGASITPDDTRFALASANIDGALHNYRHGPSSRTGGEATLGRSETAIRGHTDSRSAARPTRLPGRKMCRSASAVAADRPRRPAASSFTGIRAGPFRLVMQNPGNCSGSSRPVLARRQPQWSTRSTGTSTSPSPAGGNQGVGSANGDAVWTFSLKGQLNPLWPPPPPPTIAGPASGPIADNVDTVKIGDNNIEFGYFPKRDRIKAGTALTFTNAGDTRIRRHRLKTGKSGPGTPGL